MTARLIRTWLSTAAATCFVFMLPLGASAQTYSTDPGDRTVSSWARLQELSAQLERDAGRARSEAKADERHRGSEEYAERLDDFAKEAHKFREMVNDRTVGSSKINDELRKLVDHGRKVQEESARAERHNPRTDADWNRTLATLDQINSEYLAASGLAAPRYGTQSPAPGPNGYSGSFPAPSTDNDRAQLDELERRSDDALRLSESARLDITPDIERLRSDVRSFESGASRRDNADASGNVSEVLSEARTIQASLAGSNAPARLVDDVNVMVDTLTRMRDANTAVGTTGYVTGPFTGDYATMDVPQLTQELQNRLADVSGSAARYGAGDASTRIAQFTDRVRDFDSRAARMSPEDRRETIGRLLEDAQKTQRDLAGRHVGAPLMNRWNDIVDLLVHLRDRS